MNRYLTQLKPRILILLTLTGIVAYIIPSPFNINFANLVVFVFFGVCSAGGALVINNVIDRDIDAVMTRTSKRSSVGPDAIPVRNLLIYGVLLSVIGIIGGFVVFGIYAAFFYAWGNIFYLTAYSLYLKRKSILNTILGGLASPSPVWAGYAARFDELNLVASDGFLGVSLEGWLLGLLVFIWTPSHTWAMAGKNFEDYKNTNIPMLPVIIGLPRTALWTLVFGIVTILYGFWLSIWIAGIWYILIIITIPSLYLLYGCWKFYREPTVEMAKYCFKTHNIYMTAVFIIILVFSWL